MEDRIENGWLGTFPSPPLENRSFNVIKMTGAVKVAEIESPSG
jgi:hypothetical protein